MTTALVLSSIGFVWSVLCSVSDENRTLRQDRIKKEQIIQQLSSDLDDARSHRLTPGGFVYLDNRQQTSVNGKM